MNAIKQTINGDVLYLNHAYIGSLLFGSYEMAWVVDDREKAELMLDKINSCKDGDFEIIEI